LEVLRIRLIDPISKPPVFTGLSSLGRFYRRDGDPVGGGVPPPGAPGGVRDHRGTHTARPRPHAGEHTAKAVSILAGGLCERKKRGPRVASPVRSQAPLQRTVAMGAARGFVDTAGRNTEAIRRYIQEQEDERLDQLEWPELDGGQVNRKKTRKTNVLNAALDGAHS